MGATMNVRSTFDNIMHTPCSSTTTIKVMRRFYGTSEHHSTVAPNIYTNNPRNPK